MRSDADRVSDILEAAAKIRERVTDSVDTFQGDEMLQILFLTFFAHGARETLLP